MRRLGVRLMAAAGWAAALCFAAVALAQPDRVGWTQLSLSTCRVDAFLKDNDRKS